MNTKLIFATAAAAALLIACNDSKVRRAPSLVKENPASKAPPERGALEKAGDVTWGVVTAPVRLVAPEKKPQVKREPETYEPTEVIIRGPRRIPPKAAATQPTEEPSTQPAPE